jgi:ribosomal protein S18 acetylase RimI-like enzyme
VDGLQLRPVGAGDGELLLRIYAGTRAQELVVLPWDDAAKAAFLRAQLAAQSAAYAQYPGRSNRLVVLGGEPVGRLDVARGEREIMVLDISLLPEHRGRGIGTALLRDVLDEAAAAGKRVRLHVARSNPALRLYRRLGFREVADLGVDLRLEAAPYVKTGS